MPPFPRLASGMIPAAALPVACAAYFGLRYRSPAYLAGASLLLIGWFLFLAAGRRSPAARWGVPLGRWDRMGLIAFLAAAVGLFGLGAWQFLNLADIGDLDQAAYAQALWNLRHGNLDFDFHGRNLFGIHSQYTIALWIPVQWLAGELGLKIGNGLCLVAAALLVVLRFGSDRGLAWWGGLLLLLSPPMASQFFFGFHPEILAAPVLVLCLNAYREEKLTAFLAWTAVLACTKETMTLAVAGILILALIERRPWRWWLLPGLLCCALMAAYWFLVLPRFAPAGNPLGFFLPSPRSIPAHWARPETLAYLWHIYLPALPMACLSPKRYLVLPLPLMAFYAAFPDPLFMVLWPNYAFPLAILALGPLILRPALSLTWSGKEPTSAASVLDARLLAAGAVIALLAYPTWREIFSVPAEGLAKARMVAELRAAIPETASVVVNGPFHARLAARREIAIWGWNRNPLAHYDYAVVDTSYHVNWLVDGEALASGLAELSDTAAWQLRYARGGLRAYRRLGPRLARAEVPIRDPLEPARKRFAPGQRIP